MKTSFWKPFFLVLSLTCIGHAAESAHDRAQMHFRTAQDLYNRGDYAAAKDELQQAHELDPSAKELLYNLSIISEKMQDFDAAITYLREVAALTDTTAEEKDSIEKSIRRLDGAKKSQKKPEEASPKVIVKTVTVKEPETSGPGLSPVVIGIGAFSLAAVATGVTTGILALTQKPSPGVATSSAYPFTDWRADQDRAQQFALVSDVSFGLAAAGAIATGLLYWLLQPHERAR